MSNVYIPAGMTAPAPVRALGQNSAGQSNALSTWAASPWRTVWTVASVASTGLCAYHGYRRNDSVGWALGWALLGGLFPVVVPAIAFAQGFGQPAKE